MKTTLTAEHWQQFSATDDQSNAEAQAPSQPVLAVNKDQTISLLRDLSNRPVAQDGPEQEVRIWQSAVGQGYRVENGTLGLRTAPEQAGGITALTYKGVNLLQTAGPQPKSFGDNSIWWGGIRPTRTQESPGLLGSLLCDPNNLLSWQIEPTTATKKQNWQGIALTRHNLCIRYEMQPRNPTLRLVVEYHNTGSVTQIFYLLFHLFFRSMQPQVPEKVYYELYDTKSCLVEEHKTRRVYANDWSIIAPGKDLALALWAEPETHLEIATYEWPRDGFQHILMLPFQVAPGAVQRANCHLLVADSLAQLLSAAGFSSSSTGQRSLQERASRVLI